MEGLGLIGSGGPTSGHERPRQADLGPVCFEMPSHYEISVEWAES